MPHITVTTEDDYILRSKGSESKENEHYKIAINDEEANSLRKSATNYIRTTKYTLITFIPKNLFEQFRRASNFYFLVVVIIQLIPGLSPLIPITNILPLAFVLTVTAIKEAFEDYGRYKADQKNNKELFTVYRSTGALLIQSQHIKPGDLVHIVEGQNFPADLILLSSSSSEGQCFVQTANLDGETNLKSRKAVNATVNVTTGEHLLELKGNLYCEIPNERLYQFNGNMVMWNEAVHPVSSEQFLQRGAQLMNTAWCNGIVVYTGVDTKLSKNLQPAPSKFSTVEKSLNKFIWAVFGCQMGLCFINSLLSGTFQSEKADYMPYLGANEYSLTIYSLRNFFTYFILFNTMIPISLWVTLEIIKVTQARFMNWDNQMTLSPEKVRERRALLPITVDKNSIDIHMSAKTSNLNEDLGRIQHIFSDKTGTLTENEMSFKKSSIKGIIYDEASSKGSMMEKILEEDPNSKHIRDFLLVMALCHTSVPQVDKRTGKIIYKSQSPDETALVDAAAQNEIIFVERKSNYLVIEEFSKQSNYELLASLEFSSGRRRMSNIVKTPEGKIMLLCKGADNVIKERVKNGDEFVDITSEHLKIFSKAGLRTLLFAHRELSENEFFEWREIYDEACSSIDERVEKIESAWDLIEKDFDLVGCSAIEDKLQAEVPETIHYLLEAGIQIWVLTGDQQDTAINIGYATKLLVPEMTLVIINADNSEMCGQMIKISLSKFCGINYDLNRRSHQNFSIESDTDREPIGLVIDGASLGFALRDHSPAFLALGRQCKSVICCRVTPLQKALVVRTVKRGEKKIALSVGDGANDVSMIQEAHVGVGVWGKEGTQAARASDYAIHQFSHLKRLLCVHGRYSFFRISTVIKFFFYKNIAFTLSMFYFSFFNGFTGQTIYDSWIITLYNIVFTSIPPFIYGIIEKDLGEEVIDENPQAYKRMQRGDDFSLFSFAQWMFSAIWHSIVTFFGVYALFSSSVIEPHGRTLGLWTMGLTASSIMVIIVNLRLAMEMRHWTILNFLAVFGSIFTYFLTVVFYSSVPRNNMTFEIFFLMSSPSFYLLILILVVTALLPDVTYLWLYRSAVPFDWQVLRERYYRRDRVIPLE